VLALQGARAAAPGGSAAMLSVTPTAPGHAPATRADQAELHNILAAVVTSSAAGTAADADDDGDGDGAGDGDAAPAAAGAPHSVHEAAVMRKMRARLQAAARAKDRGARRGRFLRACGHALLTMFVTLLALPVSLVLFVVTVIMTVARSIGRTGWVLRALFVSLLLLVPTIAGLAIYVAAANTVRDKTPVDVTVALGTAFAALTLIRSSLCSRRRATSFGTRSPAACSAPPSAGPGPTSPR